MSTKNTQWIVGYPNEGITGPTASPLVWFDQTDTKSQIVSCGHEVMAIVARHGGLTEEDHERARLIAAAPDLLAAMPTVGHPGGRLMKVVAHYADGSTQTIDGDVIVAAVAKATGEA